MNNEMKKLMDDTLETVNAGVANGELYYKIEPGDNLHKIAAKHGTTVYKLLILNPQIKDPNLIYAGDSLRIF